jgi:hypothetical protein
MHFLTVAPLLGLLVYSANAAHIPSAKQLGDITLLAQNNLRSKPYPGIPISAGPVEHYQIKNHKLTSSLASDSKNTSAALLLNSKKSYDDAATSCAALSEKLWSPSTQDFNAGLNSSLSHEVFAGNFPAIIRDLNVRPSMSTASATKSIAMPICQRYAPKAHQQRRTSSPTPLLLAKWLNT